MKTILIFFLFVLGCFAFTGCKSKAVPGETKEKIILQKEIVRDTVLTIEKDSSFYSAYIECINGKPVLKESKALPKNRPGRSLAVPNVKLKNGVLSVDCHKEAEKMFFAWKEKFTQEWNTHNKPVPVPVKLTNFQIIKMTIGSIVIWAGGLIALVYLIRFIIRKKLI